jgi:hypothetical protein
MRRFGKSLFVSTLKEIFKGNKELFKDQYIFDRYSFDQHPVIHIDFNLIDHKSTIESFEEEIKVTLLEHAKEYDVMSIGNPLMRSPDFPLTHTVRETFTSYGVPSKLDSHNFTISDCLT